ncbi:hypothetical protein LTR37_007700 [Vermiconidia calcicola]|uniref:Uncharacterized protein n=1 Tax=Vermiconidia calcicola TaxID=1690605 RepID=A0ACC3NCW4_9PEZI|nr:hypothetical protein LTR37_007700 [Vermiconidia calcicola]
MAKATPPPDLKIPSSNHTIRVSVIDTTAHVNVPVNRFMGPPIHGHETLAAPCYGFLIEHDNPAAKTKYDTLLFDIGVRLDFMNGPKVVVDQLKAFGVKVEVQKDVVEILRENGQDVAKVGGIIWSHWHWDHTGDPSTFPWSTDLIVGPGFGEAFTPAYPTVEESPVDERAWEGRTLREINFDIEGKGLKIGQYKAFDFYGDGSYYLLDTPGHAVGHMCGLARTSARPPEFIFMGGDIAHHGGEFRPTKFVPLPENIVPNPLVAPFSRQTSACPGHLFENLHPQKSSTEPFYKPTLEGVHKDGQEAKESIDKMGEFDAHDNIFVNIAHDSSLYDMVEFYPKVANGWSQKRWKEEGRWRFLRDFDTGASEAHT